MEKRDEGRTRPYCARPKPFFVCWVHVCRLATMAYDRVGGVWSFFSWKGPIESLG
jgi:hypothetical protein